MREKKYKNYIASERKVNLLSETKWKSMRVKAVFHGNWYLLFSIYKKEANKEKQIKMK